jgi:hypothetical protein
MRGAWCGFVLIVLVVGATGVLSGQRGVSGPVEALLLGDWRGTGVVSGQASSVTMTWTHEPGPRVLHLRFRNDLAGGRGAQTFEGRGYYRLGPEPGVGAGIWIDSRGLFLPVATSITADSLTSEWGSETTERGRTVYRFVDADTLEVVDWVRTPNGDLREFGRVRVTRRR